MVDGKIVTNVDSIISQYKIANFDLRKRIIKNILFNHCMNIIAFTRPLTPYDTGALQGSWQLNVSSYKETGTTYSVDILNNQEYASYQEFGTRMFPGRFMFTKGNAFAESILKNVSDTIIRKRFGVIK